MEDLAILSFHLRIFSAMPRLMSAVLTWPWRLGRRSGRAGCTPSLALEGDVMWLAAMSCQCCFVSNHLGLGKPFKMMPPTHQI